MSAVLRRRRRRRSAAGYTIMEMMLALALMIVGVVGIVSMEKTAIVTNSHAKNLAVAQRIAQSWSTQLQLDTNSWRTGFNSAGVLSAPTGTWLRPGFVTGRVGGAFDSHGNPLSDSGADLLQARYCVNTRLSWLYNNAGVSGNGVIRAEIRVYWLREGQKVPTPASGLCPIDADIDAVGQDTTRYHFIYQTVGIRQRFQI